MKPDTKTVAIVCAVPGSVGTPPARIGDALAFANSGPVPAGWLVCDGRWVSVYDYPFLFAVIGHQFSGGWIRRFIAGRGRPGMFRLPDYGHGFIPSMREVDL